MNQAFLLRRCRALLPERRQDLFSCRCIPQLRPLELTITVHIRIPDTESKHVRLLSVTLQDFRHIYRLIRFLLLIDIRQSRSQLLFLCLFQLVFFLDHFAIDLPPAARVLRFHDLLLPLRDVSSDEGFPELRVVVGNVR